MTKEIILIDCDQCLLNYNQRVANIYEELFNVKPVIKDATAFKAANIYDFSVLKKAELEAFQKACSGANLWSKMPAMDGALEFVNQHKNDFEFIVLTRMVEEFKDIRHQNLTELGFEIKDVWAVPRVATENPKEKLARETGAVFFIDDLVKNFEGIHDIPTKMVLIDHKYTDGANDKRDGIRIDHSVSSFKELSDTIVTPYLEDKNRIVQRRRFR